MLKLILLALCYEAVASNSIVSPVTPLPIPVAAVPNPYVAGVSPAYPGYKGYRSPFYNPASATAPIISYSNTRGIDGSYAYSYATGDGKQAQETGFLKDAYIDNTGSPQGTQVVEGSYSYTSPEGIPIQVNYVADENGFRPAGVHIPSNGGPVVAPVLPVVPSRNIFDPRLGAINPLAYRNQFDPLKPYNQKYNIYNPHHNLEALKTTKI